MNEPFWLRLRLIVCEMKRVRGTICLDREQYLAYGWQGYLDRRQDLGFALGGRGKWRRDDRHLRCAAASRMTCRHPPTVGTDRGQKPRDGYSRMAARPRAARQGALQGSSAMMTTQELT